MFKSYNNYPVPDKTTKAQFNSYFYLFVFYLLSFQGTICVLALRSARLGACKRRIEESELVGHLQQNTAHTGCTAW